MASAWRVSLPWHCAFRSRPPSVSFFHHSAVPGVCGNCLNSRPQSWSFRSASAAAAAAVEPAAGSLGLVDFLLDGGKTTSVAHAVWQRVVRPGDVVIDATCGNGLDTLELAKLVYSEETPGRVFGLDIQESAVQRTAMLLESHLTPAQTSHVELLTMCHSKLHELAADSSVRLVAFNLGYLPGGDKHIITAIDTTLKALTSATRLVCSGGLISLMAYVGHPGGREEYEAVRDYSQALPTQGWVVSHHEWLNRPTCPRLLLLHRK